MVTFQFLLLLFVLVHIYRDNDTIKIPAKYFAKDKTCFYKKTTSM